MKSLPAVHLTELTEPVLLKAGEFKAQHRMSLADALIAAWAFIHRATLVHKDPEFEVLTVIDQMTLSYKPKRHQQ